jgi:hypothetical protein
VYSTRELKFHLDLHYDPFLDNIKIFPFSISKAEANSSTVEGKSTQLVFTSPVAAGVWSALGVNTSGCKVSQL